MMTLDEISRLVGGLVEGDSSLEIHHLAKIEEALEGEITFLANPKYQKYLGTTQASAVLVSHTYSGDLTARVRPLSLVRVADPYQAFLRLIEVFYPAPRPQANGVDPSARIAPGVKIGEDVSVGAYVVIGEDCVLGRGVSVYPNTVLHEGVTVGEGSCLYANVTIRERCRLGKRVIVHSGTVIGSDGFGFAPREDGSYEKIPQRGIVVIEDDVEIGSNCAIDRATIGETRIRRGSKLDNLIQVAHNVVIGEDSVIAAQTGISGSTKLGKNCMIAGQVGFVGHLKIADRTSIGAQSGVSRDIQEPGQTYFGYPAKPHRQALRLEGSVRRLPELVAEMRELRERLTELEALIDKSTKA